MFGSGGLGGGRVSHDCVCLSAFPFAPLHPLRQITKMWQDDFGRKSCDIFTHSNRKLVLLLLWKKLRRVRRNIDKGFTVVLPARPSEHSAHLTAVSFQHSFTSPIFKVNYMYAVVIVVVGASDVIKNYLVFKPKVGGKFSWHVRHPQVSPFISVFEHEVITCCSAGLSAASE